jgi:predicted dehydrogenase
VAAAKVGKHVLLEKPLAANLREGRQIAKAVEKAGVTCMVMFNERHRWPVVKIRELVESGRIGEPYMIRTDHNQNPQFAPKQWYRSKARSGGGALIGSGIHMLDLLHWFGGEVRQVSAVTRHIPGRVDEEAAACVIVQFADGKIGSLDISWAAPRHPWYQFLVLYGTKGTATTLGGEVTVSTPERVETIPSPVQDSYSDSFVNEIRYFGECLVEGKQPMTHPADAVKSLEICMAAYRAAETRSVIGLPFEE